ncbi:MAG: DUF1508 domain-containing protein [Gammaproteobacteria bacterium]|nr:YegP family protein [Xanthomonadales bacterium]NIS05528.1 YegP family protein [Gammaproteobacteria bacterium]NIV48135.1 DUF1508 domain-containing protein [Gammaproteobacteria bacterium]NIW02774.1 DUF1508 domain-containing protein [Gammaproteobacteria bacterium]NIW55837.1 DUF1508 domain-containing protein [Gammaproteobacteria bacterium]
MQNNCSDEKCLVKTTTPSGKHRFNMRAKNNQVIDTSRNYESEAACEKGMQAIPRAAEGATVVDLTK